MLQDDHFSIHLGNCNQLLTSGMRLEVANTNYDIDQEYDCLDDVLNIGMMLQPKVLILQIYELSSTLEQILQVSRETKVKVIIICSSTDDILIANLIKNGISGYILPDDTEIPLVKILDVIVQGKMWFSPSILSILSGMINKHHEVDELPLLTAKEKEILQLLCDGLTNKEMSKKLGVSLRTVEYHLSNIYCKLNISSRVQAILWAQQNITIAHTKGNQ